MGRRTSGCDRGSLFSAWLKLPFCEIQTSASLTNCAGWCQRRLSLQRTLSAIGTKLTFSNAHALVAVERKADMMRACRRAAGSFRQAKFLRPDQLRRTEMPV